MNSCGFVTLVGAGPGDPELITVRGLNRLRAAEVVVYDRLIHPQILDEVPVSAERIFVGKALGTVVMDQRSIESLLIDRAITGKRVVRLKGGDPFVFGRGAEEIEALAAAGIPYEVVPGITSAVAVPSAAGIPVTHRELSSCFTVVTGHEDPTKSESSMDWGWLAQSRGTIVVLMGLERLSGIVDRLISGGRDPATPAAVVSHGTLPQERSIIAPLHSIAAVTSRSDFASPAVVVIGEVAAFPHTLAAAGYAALARAV